MTVGRSKVNSICQQIISFRFHAARSFSFNLYYASYSNLQGRGNSCTGLTRMPNRRATDRRSRTHISRVMIERQWLTPILKVTLQKLQKRESAVLRDRIVSVCAGFLLLTKEERETLPVNLPKFLRMSVCKSR